MTTLNIPLPTQASGEMPKQVSYRWCKALYDALQPLKEYLLQNGAPAVNVDVATSPYTSVSLWKSWEERDEIALTDICNIGLTADGMINFETIVFRYKDFRGDGSSARKKFAKVIKHLEEHAVPQVAPEWIAKALEALNGK